MKKTEFERMLIEQLGLLADACKLFDQGVARQIKSVSTRLYVICHDLVRSPEWKEWGTNKDVLFASCSRPRNPRNIIEAHHPLAEIAIGPESAKFIAMGTSSQHKSLRFSKWWDEEVLRLSRNNSISRKNIVFQMRNYDGGAHGFMNRSSIEYKEISNSPNLGFIAGAGGRSFDFISGALEATTRQIANEVFLSILPHLHSEQIGNIGFSIASN